jgi:hypothetical protein
MPGTLVTGTHHLLLLLVLHSHLWQLIKMLQTGCHFTKCNCRHDLAAGVPAQI